MTKSPTCPSGVAAAMNGRRRPIVFPRLPDNPHLAGILSLFGDIVVPPTALPPCPTVIFLCYTNRCGSNYLAEALHSSGRINMADEMLNADWIAAEAPRHGHTTFAAYLGTHIRWRMVEGCFAIKVATLHLEVLGRAGVLDHYRDNACYVFMQRSDRLAQAISFEIARQTGLWTSHASVEMPMQQLEFSRERIARAIDGFAEHNHLFDTFFGLNGITPIHVIYERLIEDPAGEVERIGRALGMPDLRFVPEKITLRRQAGALNARWREMFLAA